ncbi:MAG: hypothetical protein Kow0056_10420 [Coriobacteriia bacterium]
MRYRTTVAAVAFATALTLPLLLGCSTEADRGSTGPVEATAAPEPGGATQVYPPAAKAQDAVEGLNEKIEEEHSAIEGE